MRSPPPPRPAVGRPVVGQGLIVFAVRRLSPLVVAVLVIARLPARPPART